MKKMNMGGMMPMAKKAVATMAQAPGRMGGIGQKVSAMMQARNPAPAGMPDAPAKPGPSWKPAKPASGSYGKLVSAAAKARNMARKAAKGGPTVMKAGGLAKANGCAKRGKTRGKMY